jgi:hypothetical protein
MNGCQGIVERPNKSGLYKSFAIRMPPELILHPFLDAVKISGESALTNITCLGIGAF